MSLSILMPDIKLEKEKDLRPVAYIKDLVARDHYVTFTLFFMVFCAIFGTVLTLFCTIPALVYALRVSPCFTIKTLELFFIILGSLCQQERKDRRCQEVRQEHRHSQLLCLCHGPHHLLCHLLRHRNDVRGGTTQANSLPSNVLTG